MVLLKTFLVIPKVFIKLGAHNSSPAGTGHQKCCFAPPTTAAPSISGRWAPSWPRSTRSGHSSPARPRSTRSSKFVLLSAHQTRYASRILLVGKKPQFSSLPCATVNNVFFTGKKKCVNSLPQYKYISFLA